VACALRPVANENVINRLSNSVFTPETLDGTGNAILDWEMSGPCFVFSIGPTIERDAVRRRQIISVD